MIKTELSRASIEQLPNFKKRGAKEYSAACPFCGEGDDRFRYWPEKGNYWCRRCEIKGFVADAPGGLGFTDEQYKAWQEAQAKRKAKEKQAKLSALEQLRQSSGRVGFYQRQMTQENREYWYREGLSEGSINKFRLGYCSACPTFRQSPSWTIPYFYQDKLYNIRHRLRFPNGSGKYRPEIPGLPTALFNADILDNPYWMTVLVEGEKKAMVLSERGFPAVGIPGANIFKEKWVKLFQKCTSVYVALDPGAEEQAKRIGKILVGTCDVLICQLPVKPDDFFVQYDGSTAEFMEFLQLGRRVK